MRRHHGVRGLNEEFREFHVLRLRREHAAFFDFLEGLARLGGVTAQQGGEPAVQTKPVQNWLAILRLLAKARESGPRDIVLARDQLPARIVVELFQREIHISRRRLHGGSGIYFRSIRQSPRHGEAEQDQHGRSHVASGKQRWTASALE